MILAIETSSNICSVAIIKNGIILTEIYINSNLKHSENLAPAIKDAVEYASIKKEEIEYIALSIGPGSFTGLRIGAATAKGLAFALSIPIIPIKSLDALAFNINQKDIMVAPIMDAKRGQVYSAAFLNQNKIIEDNVIEIESFLNKLHRFNNKDNKKHNIIFLGDGAIAYKDIILNNNFILAENGNLRPRASSVAYLAEKRKEYAIKSNQLEINYIRESSAKKMDIKYE